MSMNVFISYSTENSDLANALRDTLRALYPDINVEVMKTIMVGDNWQNVIDRRLDQADVLVAIVANTPKKEFSYTGVEVGYFIRSCSEKPNSSTGAKRLILPVSLSGSPIPDAFNGIQHADFFNYFSQAINIDFSKSSDEIKKNLIVSDTDPAYCFLAAIERVAAPTAEIAGERKEVLKDHARKCFGAVVDFIRAQPLTEEQPKGKIVVHLPANVWDIEKADISLEGPLGQMLPAHNAGNIYAWPKVSSALATRGIADEWREAIQSLLISVSDGTSDNADQIATWSDTNGDALSRMFVSKSIAYYDGRREVHIYVIRLNREKDYGYRHTTTLWRGIGSCIKLRFLLIEPIDIEVIINTHLNQGRESLKKYAREFKTEFIAAERLWKIAELDDPSKLIEIVGSEQANQVAEMTAEWREQRGKLMSEMEAVISANDTDLNDACARWKSSIKEFRKKISQYNAKLLVKMLEQLTSDVRRSMADDLQ